MKRAFLVATALLGLAVRLTAEDAIQHTLRLMPGPGNSRNSEGDFISLKDGRILFIYSHFYDGKGGDQDPAYLASRVSTDGGKTWSTEDVKVIGNEGGLNVMSVSLERLQDGRIALLYGRKESMSDNPRVIRFSSDKGATWSEPIDIIPKSERGYYSANNDRLVQLHSGRLILPIVQHNGAGVGEAWSEIGRVCAYLSDDAGKTWRRSKDAFYADNPQGERVVAQEPGIVELKDHSLLMFLRTNAGFQYFSTSKDGGETWAKAIPSPTWRIGWVGEAGSLDFAG